LVEIPEELLRRSAEARAAATGQPVDDVLAEMLASIGDTASDEPVESAPTDAEPEHPTTPPDDLLEREAEARAGVLGVTKADAVAELKGEKELDIEVSEPIEPQPKEKPEPAAPAAPEPVPAAAAPAAAGGEIDWAAAATSAGMSEKLFRRSVEAKAKAKGVDAAVVLAEMTGEPLPAAPAAAAPATAPAAAAAAPAAAAAAPAPATATIPKGVRPQRLLTVVKAKAIQQVKVTPSDKVSTWPHLLLIEFVALLAITALLIVMSVVIQAPLLEAANANVTPNPSKAPWYFLGLQELLTYFDPQIAGVTVPTIIGLIGFMAIPYIDRNPSNKPADRKFAIFMYTFFIMGAATLTIIGTLFRGKGFNFTYPWTDGIFFDDLKDWITFE
jgi:hypothetical protein